MSGGTTWNTDFATLTVDNYIRESVTDQVFTDHGLMRVIEDKIGIDRVRGGDNILIPIGTAQNTQGGSYSGFDQFDTDPQDTLTNAFYGFKSYQKPIVAQFREVARNRSEQGVLDMWMQKSQLALDSLRADLNVDAFADGTGNGGKNMLGLSILVDSAGTVGGIARGGANAFWNAQELASGGALAIDTAVGMLQLYNNCSTGSGDTARPDVIVTTQTVHQAYENLLAPDIRHVSGAVGEGAFSGLEYKGVPLMWDNDCTTQTMYMLHTPSFEFYIHPESDFTTTEIQTGRNGHLNQDAWMAHIIVWPELVMAESRRNGKLTGITG